MENCNILSFAAKVVYPGRAFLRRLYWSKPIKDNLLWWETNFYFDGMESHCYAHVVNIFHYGQIHLNFAAKEGIFYLAIALFTSSARTSYLQQNLFFKQSNRLQFI